jgi:hypothetical protein
LKGILIANRPTNYVPQIGLSAAAKISEEPSIASKPQKLLLNHVTSAEISCSNYGSPKCL